jgi:hypothetical protein
MLSHHLRPEYRAPDVPVAVNMRPEQKMFELEYAVPTSYDHFDGRAVRDERMTRMKHTASEVSLKSSHFVGIVDSSDDIPCVHLHPLESLQIVRPDMRYLDVAEAPVVTKKSTEPTRMTAQFKRTDARAVAARKNSFAHLKEVEESDPWVPLSTHSAEVRFGPLGCTNFRHRHLLICCAV